ncbi:ribosomal large subunit pseudouridine synthase B [Ezakiella coagulans]|uniref:Ribosomal large subunit pseudouridine synthase B n=1 Tax=Ezakiella coagulans TaxID=46507 RepID=A0A2U1E2S4_9FIRM|nr:pseudouridine synthase [Ezakiella coagulans]PVY94195.1 ribosomal large subunit pseudouridine synthase B [Ezakiella coagulans]
MGEMRINKYIAACGFASRRKADELVLNGLVAVNGEVINEPGYMVDIENDAVKVKNKLLKIQNADLYYVLNKPLNYLSSNKDPHSKNLARNLIHYKGHLFNVGRLDSDTSGLLIYTNDGDFANIMTHPSYNIKKRYEVSLNGYLKDDTKDSIEQGVLLDDGKTKKCKIEIKKRTSNSTRLHIIISEGKNRQIRRMFEKFGFAVTELKRLTHGRISLDGVREGQYRVFTKDEILYVNELKQKHL